MHQYQNEKESLHTVKEDPRYTILNPNLTASTFWSSLRLQILTERETLRDVNGLHEAAHAKHDRPKRRSNAVNRDFELFGQLNVSRTGE